MNSEGEADKQMHNQRKSVKRKRRSDNSADAIGASQNKRSGDGDTDGSSDQEAPLTRKQICEALQIKAADLQRRAAELRAFIGTEVSEHRYV